MAQNGEVGVKVADGGAEDQEVDFKKVSQVEAFEILKCTPHGITSAEVQERLKTYGYNKLPEETRNPILVYLSYMWNPLSWAMEAAAIIAIALLDYADFALIVALLLVNSTISYVEEANADKAIKALASALAPRAKALRDGEMKTVDASELVPGDVIIVRLGDIVPADIKILFEGEVAPVHANDETPLQVDQAALTGESLPVKKFSGDVAFAGSTIKQGERHCLKIMTRIGGCCLITIGVWIIIELSVQFGHYHHSCRAGVGNCPTLTNMLVIIVGGIPIAMPTVLSVTLALGAFKLAREGAIVSRMSAVEEMAGMDILCSDKTGTLTLNKLTVDHVNTYNMSGHSIEDVLKFGALSANIVTEEPIDMVLHESYPERDTLWSEYKLAKFVPFNPTDKITIASVTDVKTGEKMRVMKGAPQVVVRFAHDCAEIESACHDKIVEYANRGFRALGIARAEGHEGDPTWVMVGLVPLFDPPRHDTKDTIERCLEMGIHVKMITGDQLLIGKETAKQLGMGTNMFTTEALLKAKQGIGLVEGHASVEDLIENADGFAEVYPEHKFMIVKVLQERKHMCGMTGDGVNDAPALKKADVGIAVAGATDAARGAADIVLTEPGLYTIVGAIIGARKIFQRMTTYSRYTVAMTFRICFTFGLLTVIYDWYFPTILIVLLAVFNDGAMIALSKDRVTPSRLPNRWNLPSIFTSGIVYGLYLTLSSWVLYYVATHLDFFENKTKLVSLNVTEESLTNFCTSFAIPAAGATPDATLCTVPTYAEQLGASCDQYDVLNQCITEQRYVRGAMMRSLLYLQVSVSGQALVFVVRCVEYSLLSRAGLLTYVAFFVAQVASTLIAAFGFNGYEEPSTNLEDCVFCTMSSGNHNPFWNKRAVPLEGTESAFTASVIGCLGYVIVAWIWSAIWYMGLDPLKWALFYVLNEEGFRNGGFFSTFYGQRGEAMGTSAGVGINKNSMSRVSLARGSAQQRVSMGGKTSGGIPGVGGSMVPGPAMLERASIVRVPK
ncbi:hypothetical protein APUTEX25_000420 [Auxenochlorella protothecoides]|uniref:Plasma membrane ATPase n=1 Tax=Auxenochlorella protothecoides TaxID=3075 RepID=A0A3M7KWK0_AUXPR|nr:hypothetical protein APUTEX25_000420 [Auxenochlorella protothecoides]|eukprot:RMZ54903.1 hypothetical protein APUTEX25_000420 [Auxenochlorella protothecoides]